MELFAAAGLRVQRSSSVSYRATIDDERIAEVRILRPQEIPLYVQDGLFDIGITGRDWIEETGASVQTVTELRYSKATANDIKIVLAVAGDSSYQSANDLPQHVRISTEFPGLTKRFFASKGIDADILLSYGATEAKVPEIADAVVDLTETGSALRAAGLRIIDTLLISRTELIANTASLADLEKQRGIQQIATLLLGVLAARGRVLLKLNVSDDKFEDVLKLVPAMKSPTVSRLWGDSGYAIETVVDAHIINVLIPKLKEAGATDFLELPIHKAIP